MRAKSMLLLLVAIGCGVVASVAVSQIVLDKKTDTKTAQILVVTKNVSAAAKITPEIVSLEQWPIDRIPQGAITDPKLVEGKFAKQPLYSGEPLIEIKLANKGKELFVPEGYRVFDLQVTDNTGGSGYISPGDRVDVFGFFEKGMRINASKSVRVMENLEVWMVDGIAMIDPEAAPSARRSSSTFQLLVKDKQYTVLDTAQNLGKLRVALRPPRKDDESKDRLDEGENFLSWLKTSEASKTVERTASSEDDYVPVASRVEHEMTIVTPDGTNKFQWKQGDKSPQKVEEGESTSVYTGISTAGIQSGQPPAAIPPHMQDPTQGTKPTSTTVTQPTGTVGINPQTPSGAPKPPNAPNTVWDSTTGTWQVGGFSATYPGVK